MMSRVKAIHTVEDTIHVYLCGTEGRVSFTLTLVGDKDSDFADDVRSAYAQEQQLNVHVTNHAVVTIGSKQYHIPFSKEDA